jgi:class 3 adenylate cyclase/tetratricopeptide (TPR) repeat protein
MHCESCGLESAAGARFCSGCGSPLAASAVVESRRERKVVTVLFCDLVGFTARSEAEDPEDVQRRLRRYHALLRQRIESFGGTVEKFIGDAVMAVFGAPLAHEDDPERAVRAALRIIEALDDLNAEESELELAVRIGVNTGEAVVDLDAHPERGEGFVTGDVVNTAARIQTGAPTDGIAVGEATYRATQRVFEYEVLPPVEAKGKAQPVAVWRPLRPHGRFGVDFLRSSDTPFVGREVERTLLQGLFERASRDGSVQLVTIVGEPGVGKSRLVGELSDFIDERPELVTWRQGRCLPYGEGITFWALGELVKAHAGIYDSDTPEAAAAKLMLVLPESDERTWLRARLLPLLGVGSPDADTSGSTSRDESFAAWRRFLETVAEDGPTVLVIEDMHWADAALLQFLAYFAEWAADVQLLLVCTARPELYERHGSWAGGIRNATSINLAPLSASESQILIGALLERSELTTRAEATILERAGGNPLYAEEFVRLLAERALDDRPEDDVALHSQSIEALIAARLDTLALERKALLQDASVLGKVFWTGALVAMAERDPREVEVALHELTRKELVRRSRTSSVEGEAEYSFWHGLVRDVAYAQIPRSERARRHVEAAAWIEGQAGERLEDVADILAHHYRSALDLTLSDGGREIEDLTVHARRFLVLAGDRALGLDLASAAAFFEQAIALTPRADDAHPLILLRLAEAMGDAGQLDESAAAVEQAISAFRERGDREQEATGLVRLAQLARDRSDGDFLTLAKEAVRLLEELPPGPPLVAAHEQLATAYLHRGLPVDSIAACQHALDLAAELGLPVPARALGYLGDARVELGDESGLAAMQQAVDLFVEAGAGSKSAGLMNNLALAQVPVRGPAVGLAGLDRASAFARQRGLRWVHRVIEDSRAYLLFEIGRLDEAIEVAGAAADEGGGADFARYISTACAIAFRVARDGAADDVDPDELVEIARAYRGGDLLLNCLGAAAALERARGRYESAAALLTELEATPGIKSPSHYAQWLPGLVRDAVAAGDVELAKRLADGVQPLYPLHRLALATAAAVIAEAEGDPAKATALYSEAAAGWEEYGWVREHELALAGLGRTADRGRELEPRLGE